MKLSQTIPALALSAFALVSASASALTIVNADNPAGATFTGFDWDNAGTAYATGFAGTAGDTFQLTFFDWADALKNGPFTLNEPNLDLNPDGVANGTYEYTIVATLNETFVGCVGTNCEFQINSGTFTIYYDDFTSGSPADAAAGSLGTGFADGTSIISGTIPLQIGGSFNLATNSGFNTLTGLVNFTNATYVTPPISGTNATTTLQLGSSQTNWVNPGGFNGTSFATLGANPIFQADANQSFVVTPVPEPASLALLGLGLGAMGWTLRRKRS